MCIRGILTNFLAALILVTTPVATVYSQEIVQSLEKKNVSTPPDPRNLQSKWMTYFDVQGEELKQRIFKTKKLLNSYASQIEVKEDKNKAENFITQIDSHLETLSQLKDQTAQAEPVTWLPKTSYTLEEYLSLSDEIRRYQIELENEREEFNSYQNFYNNLYQTYSNAYASYLATSDDNLEHFMLGLQTIALGTRLLYYKEAVALLKQGIKVKERQFERLSNERDYIDKNIQIAIDLSNLKEKKQKLDEDYEAIHRELMNLEVMSIESYSAKKGIEVTRLMNQKLTKALINEADSKAKLVLLKLITAIGNLDKTEADKDLTESAKTFVQNTEEQAKTWNELLSDQFDNVSRAISKDQETEEKTPSEEINKESLDVLFSSRALLNSLNYDLYHIQLMLRLLENKIVEEEDTLEQVSFYMRGKLDAISKSMDKWLHYSIFEIAEVPITIWNIIKALLIIVIAFFISNLVGSGLRKVVRKEGVIVQPTLYIFERIIHYVVIITGIMFALGSLGLTMQNLAILIGALGIGVGFGLQNIVNNFLSGLAILFERNVKVGDYIELDSGHFGKVIEVNVQNSTIHTFDGNDILVPNSMIIGTKVINWTKKDPHLRLHVPFGVAYGSDQDQVKAVIKEAAFNVPFTTSKNPAIPQPDVWLVNFGESSLDFELIVWVNIFKWQRGRKAMTAAYLSEIEKTLKAHDIHIPFPQRDLYLKAMPPEVAGKGG